MHNNVIGAILNIKFELFDKAADMLPDVVRSEIRKVRTEILTEIRDGLSTYLDKPSGTKGEKSLKKIELD